MKEEWRNVAKSATHPLFGAVRVLAMSTHGHCIVANEESPDIRVNVENLRFATESKYVSKGPRKTWPEVIPSDMRELVKHIAGGGPKTVERSVLVMVWNRIADNLKKYTLK